MARTTARCWSCGYAIQNWRSHVPAPKRCPSCGYEGSRMDALHALALKLDAERTRYLAEGRALLEKAVEVPWDEVKPSMEPAP
jgi:hypothetical protein